MQVAAIATTLALVAAGCQSSSGIDDEREYIGDIDLADFAGTWSMPSPDGEVRFEVQQGADGRYFGYAVRSTAPDAPALVLYEVGAFSTIIGWWDSDEDDEWDFRTRCDVLSYGRSMHCKYYDPEAGYLSEARATRFGDGLWVRDRLGLSAASAPAAFSPKGYTRNGSGSRIPAGATSPGTSGSGSGTDCWEREQNRIAAKFTPQITPGAICPNARVGVEMWEELLDAARNCPAPDEAEREAERALVQSRSAVQASCLG